MNIRQLFDLPVRTEKPRDSGLTMVIDSGLGLSAIRDYLDNCGEFVDYVKLGWGTAIISGKLKEKIALYRQYGIPVCLGGTFFELAHVHGKIKEYRDMVGELGLEIVEVSDGTIEMPTEQKLAYIREFCARLQGAVGVRQQGRRGGGGAQKWVAGMKREFEAGAWKCIAEGRESGTAGLYRTTSELRTGLVDEIREEMAQTNLLWEAPQKGQQAWFVKMFGSNVNLGNIAMSDVIPLETLRLGLRGDTLMMFHAESPTKV